MGIECRTVNTPQAAPIDIAKLWQTFYEEDVLSRIPGKASEDIICLYCNYEGDYTKPYTAIIGCFVDTLDKIPEGMVVKKLPASSYQIFQALGEHPAAVIQTWQEIWQTPELKRTYTGDYEVYGKNFFSHSPQEVEIYLAVEA